MAEESYPCEYDDPLVDDQDYFPDNSSRNSTRVTTVATSSPRQNQDDYEQDDDGDYYDPDDVPYDDNDRADFQWLLRNLNKITKSDFVQKLGLDDDDQKLLSMFRIIDYRRNPELIAEYLSQIANLFSWRLELERKMKADDYNGSLEATFTLINDTLEDIRDSIRENFDYTLSLGRWYRYYQH